MLRFASVSISVASSTLLDSASFILTEGERVGLVGPNSSGKSTMMDIIRQSCSNDNAETAPYWTLTSGKISGRLTSHPAGDAVVHVPQDTLAWSALFPDIADDEKELLEMSVQELLDTVVAMDDGSGTAVEEEEAWRELNVRAGKALSWDIANYAETPINQLSPGCAHRAFLALALRRPSIDLVLLDEPTNHLDLPSILWLQETVLSCGKTCIIVSHDTAFLDAVCNRVWEIDCLTKGLAVSGAAYSDYMAAKELAKEHQRAAFNAQQKRHARLTAVADNLKHKAAAGTRYEGTDHDTLLRDFKRERSGRSFKKASAIQVLRDSEEKVEAVVDHVPLKLNLRPIKSSGFDSTIILDNIEIGFNPDTEEEIKLPLPKISARINYGERIAIIGFNGVGKSTLLKTMVGAIPPLAGSVSVGRELRLGNLMQEHQTLPRNLSPRDHICAVTGLGRLEGGSRALSYGLTLHQMDAPIAQMNPGARARLILALLSMRRVNVLVLDEPSNHLDTEAVTEVMASANAFEGTVIIVSHDRKFLAGLDVTRTCSLTSDGLVDVPSVEEYVADLEETVHSVVRGSFQ
ncbi:ABC transporter [Carpediemonas membranifera]|uniref:ABC transporter n=1 Tax=Carpediemonas membranifera TaxID=201153 RepID=A0A8J6AWP7_9EUKA|nr:ABC transporter [Carpediemonas membranifera]|eukprot:KAG9396058.1 ABC transporter [Carpediemonas membranifera]